MARLNPNAKTILRIGADLALPLDAVTGTFGILATKGAGKSNAAVVMAEEMWDAGVPWVAIDPKGDWWGIRSDGDGDHPGLPIIVFGGRHGDVPLEPTAGALLADLVLAQRLTCVLDVSQFTKADTTRFLLAFGKRLFTHADDEGAEPLHLFLEEAHEYLPQIVKGDQAELVNIFQRIVKQGRFKGLGCTLISQRSSVLNKDVLELIDTLIVLRTIGPLSRKSIAAWVADQDVDAGLLASLPSLRDGEAWVWSPGALKLLTKMQFRRRRTFDSGATPKVGQVRRAPATLADVDLDAIKVQMADTIEKAKADDPKFLQKRIAELEKELRSAKPTIEYVEVEVEVPVAHGPSVDMLDELAGLGMDVFTKADELRRLVKDLGDAPVAATRPSWAERAATPPVARQESRPPPAPARPARPTPFGLGGTLPRPQRKLLTVLALYGPRTKRQLAMQAGYAIGGGAFNNPLGAIRSAGYVDPPKGEPLAITDAGLAALGEVEPLPTGQALIDHWMASLPGPCRKILASIIERPGGWEKNDLAEATGYAPSGGAFNNPLGRLRSLELVAKGLPIRLTDEFAEAIA